MNDSAPSPPMNVLELKLDWSAAASSLVMSGASGPSDPSGPPSGPAEDRVALGIIGGGSAELLPLGEKPSGGRGARRTTSIEKDPPTRSKRQRQFSQSMRKGCVCLPCGTCQRGEG